MIYLRIFLPVFFLLYFLLTFLMYAPKKKECPAEHRTLSVLNNLIWFLVMVLVVVFSLFPDAYHQYVVPFTALQSHVLSWVAVGILVLGFLIAFSAKNQQRLNRGSERKGWLLLTHGMYSKTRNPLHVAQLLTLLGFFLCIPSIFSAIILVAGVIVVIMRVRLEEKILERIFGEDYVAYQKSVSRWV